MTLDIYKFEFDENNKKYIQVYNRIKNLILTVNWLVTKSYHR